MEQQKLSMTQALWSNSNWDDDKGTRRKALADIEEKYEESLRWLEHELDPSAPDPNQDIDMDDPFFQAAQRGMEKLDRKMGNVETMPGYDDKQYEYKTDQTG